jgi:hypothetical protein
VAQALLKDSKVIYEGSETMPDYDAIFEAIRSTVGAPIDGKFADSLRRQLAVAVTEAEAVVMKARWRGRRGTAAESDDNAAAIGSGTTSVLDWMLGRLQNLEGSPDADAAEEPAMRHTADDGEEGNRSDGS